MVSAYAIAADNITLLLLAVIGYGQMLRPHH